MTASTVSLTELVDLSLGTPEVVNYKGLRSLLLAIVGHLNLGDVKTELKAEDKQELLAAKEIAKNVSSRPSSGIKRTDESALSIRSQSPGYTTSQGSISDAHFQNLEQKVSKLENQMEALNALPSNEDLMQRVKSSSQHQESAASVGSKQVTPSQTPVSEMWQLMQVQKKAAANEEGVGKVWTRAMDLIGSRIN